MPSLTYLRVAVLISHEPIPLKPTLRSIRAALKEYAKAFTTDFLCAKQLCTTTGRDMRVKELLSPALGPTEVIQQVDHQSILSSPPDGTSVAGD